MYILLLWAGLALAFNAPERRSFGTGGQKPKRPFSRDLPTDVGKGAGETPITLDTGNSDLTQSGESEPNKEAERFAEKPAVEPEQDSAPQDLVVPVPADPPLGATDPLEPPHTEGSALPAQISDELSVGISEQAEESPPPIVVTLTPQEDPSIPGQQPASEATIASTPAPLQDDAPEGEQRPSNTEGKRGVEAPAALEETSSNGTSSEAQQSQGSSESTTATRLIRPTDSSAGSIGEQLPDTIVTEGLAGSAGDEATSDAPDRKPEGGELPAVPEPVLAETPVNERTAEELAQEVDPGSEGQKVPAPNEIEVLPDATTHTLELAETDKKEEQQPETLQSAGTIDEKLGEQQTEGTSNSEIAATEITVQRESGESDSTQSQEPAGQPEQSTTEGDTIQEIQVPEDAIAAPSADPLIASELGKTESEEIHLVAVIELNTDTAGSETPVVKEDIHIPQISKEFHLTSSETTETNSDATISGSPDTLPKEMPSAPEEAQRTLEETPIMQVKEQVMTEGISTTTDSVTTTSGEILTTTSEVSTSKEEISITSAEIPTDSEEIPVTPEEIPATSEEIPATSEEIPATSEEIPATSEEIPATSEEIPVAPEEIPATSEEIPANSEEIPADSKEIPSIADKASVVSDEVSTTHIEIPIIPGESPATSGIDLKNPEEVNTSLSETPETLEELPPTQEEKAKITETMTEASGERPATPDENAVISEQTLATPEELPATTVPESTSETLDFSSHPQTGEENAEITEESTDIELKEEGPSYEPTQEVSVDIETEMTDNVVDDPSESLDNSVQSSQAEDFNPFVEDAEDLSDPDNYQESFTTYEPPEDTTTNPEKPQVKAKVIPRPVDSPPLNGDSPTDQRDVIDLLLVPANYTEHFFRQLHGTVRRDDTSFAALCYLLLLCALVVVQTVPVTVESGRLTLPAEGTDGRVRLQAKAEDVARQLQEIISAHSECQREILDSHAKMNEELSGFLIDDSS